MLARASWTAVSKEITIISHHISSKIGVLNGFYSYRVPTSGAFHIRVKLHGTALWRRLLGCSRWIGVLALVLSTELRLKSAISSDLKRPMRAEAA